jgi:hypothetical protein
VNHSRLFFPQIYAPFANLTKESPEYWELADSGKVWENYFRPFDWRTKDYGTNCVVMFLQRSTVIMPIVFLVDYQEKNTELLKEIESLKANALIPPRKLLKRMIVSFPIKAV